jgi:arginyl-tRNA synthetase
VFCLYNFARIATILRKHENLVSSGQYPPLPELDSSLLDILKDMKPEMQLIKSCLWKFSKLVNQLAPLDIKNLPQPHLLCRFLSEVSHPISRYYRTYHVLTVS